ncbi:MAG: rhodanese-like domain-containing protein [Burkholderiales bacterium]
MRSVTPQAVKAMLRDGNEFALVDVREQGVYFHEHLLFASCIPLSHLELRVADLIPRRNARVVLCDGEDEGMARLAAERLAGYGYADVAVISGGVAAWRDAGFEVFSGVNVLSKAFGEYVEHRYDTPRITAQELAAKKAAQENMLILDSRPMNEFHNVSIPGGIDCPGAELVYRVFNSAPDPQTLVVVNCAGRTRSIIGAQSLINAGIRNRVVALKDGTMGWQLAGFTPARGETAHAAPPDDTALAQAQTAAARVAERFGVTPIDHARLEQWRDESRQRTLYVLDVRTPEEFAKGHLPGSRHAPGGQLVQATDEYVATRHARIVLVDNDGVRATMTASWLKQMGWDDVHVLKDALRTSLEAGPGVPTLCGFRRATTISAGDLKDKLASDDVAVLDFASSLEYRSQHVPGAFWGVRSRIEQALRALPAGKATVLTSPDGLLAHYVANDLSRRDPPIHALVLNGGTATWVAAGYSTDSGSGHLTSEANDVWYKPYEQASEVREAMQGYLDWEVNLVKQIERDGDASFR